MQASSQNQTRWWFFGNRAGLHFQTSKVVPLPGASPVYGAWATASMADSAGNLLFYIDGGDVVYNRLHDTLANGYLKGHKGLQSCLIIRKSGSLYYIIHNNWINFTQPGIAPMLSYSIVDMTLAAGMGSVTVKKQPVSAAGLPIVEKLAATRHCDLTDHWILVHRGGWPSGSNEFLAYQVSPGGISTTPVTSAVGSIQIQFNPGNNFFSAKMKFSPNGRKVVGLYNYRTVELYDFDNATGKVSGSIRIDSSAVQSASMYPYPFDAEFSPDGTKLYVSYTDSVNGSHPVLCQFDLTKGSPVAIAASKAVIDSLPRIGVHGAPLQLAVDGKIYIATGVNAEHEKYLGVVQYPNLPGITCLYDSLGLNLGTIPNSTVPASSDNGLPGFVSNYFEQKPAIQSFSFTGNCAMVSFVFPTVTAYPATGYSVHSFQWDFGDPLSGAANTSTLVNPSHTFTANGDYTVKLLLHYKCGTDTVKQAVQITGLPDISVSGRTTICKGESQLFNFSGPGSFSLNNSALSQPSVVLQPSVTTIYTVAIVDTSAGCKTSSQFTVNVKPCTGMYASAAQGDVLIFPNPHEGKFGIILPESASVKIYDLMGSCIYSDELGQGVHSIELTDFRRMLILYVVTPASAYHYRLVAH